MTGWLRRRLTDALVPLRAIRTGGRWAATGAGGVLRLLRNAHQKQQRRASGATPTGCAVGKRARLPSADAPRHPRAAADAPHPSRAAGVARPSRAAGAIHPSRAAGAMHPSRAAGAMPPAHKAGRGRAEQEPVVPRGTTASPAGGFANRRWLRSLAVVALVLLLAAQAAPDAAEAADPLPPFDQTLAGNVIDTALTVLQPRTLEPHSAAELTVWGLNGLTAIDPSLTVSLSGGQMVLATPRGTLFNAARPPADDAAGWAALAAAMSQAAWTESAAMRSAGQQAVIQSFFDELFNHLDPYSRYVAPAPAETDRTARVGGTASAGLTLARQGRQLVVLTVNANGPAWTAGIAAGMRLMSIDAQSTRDMTPEDAGNLLLGDPGSQVVLVLADPNGRRETRYTLDRAAVPPETVFAFSNNDVVILRVTSFSTNTAQEISQFLEQATEPDPHRGRLHGLIFDLRGNRGGVLQQAVTSVALVLDHGVAVTAKGRDPQANHVWAVQGGDLTEGVPIVVLVDGRTASAAEIMAAALADQRRAVVVGSATLGKGLVQYIAQLPDGGELFVTWSRVLAPLGWPLQGLGVMPQVCTSLGQASLDRQLQDLADNQFDQRGAVIDGRAARSPLPVARILELRADCPAAIGGDADLDAARTLLDTPGAYQAALVPVPADRRISE